MFSLVIRIGMRRGTLLIVGIDERAGLVCEERICALQVC